MDCIYFWIMKLVSISPVIKQNISVLHFSIVSFSAEWYVAAKVTFTTETLVSILKPRSLTEVCSLRSMVAGPHTFMFVGSIYFGEHSKSFKTFQRGRQGHIQAAAKMTWWNSSCSGAQGILQCNVYDQRQT